MNEALSPRRDALRRGGFTLVEVVIALAIFVFGAVAIIRIFPPALGVIQNSGDKLTAINLNRTTLARLSKEASAVPYAVHGEYRTALIPTSGATAVVGTATRNNSLPKRNVQTPLGSNSALDRFKFITGEKQRVRQTFMLLNGLSKTEVKYVVTTFPVLGVQGINYTGSPTMFPQAKIYKETPMTGVVAETRLNTAINMRQSGFLNFANAQPPRNASQDSNSNFYYVSYQFLDNGILNSTTDEVVRSTTPNGMNPPIKIDDNDPKARLLQGRRLGDMSANGALGDSRVIDGPVQVRFRQLLADLSATASRYVTDDRTIQNTLNNVGILVLSETNGSSAVSVGDEVSIDYLINDWQQIVHNGLPTIIPEANPAPNPPTIPVTPPDADRTPRGLVLPLRALVDASDGTEASTSASSLYSVMSYIDPRVDATVPTLQANALNVSDVQATLTRQGPFNPTDPASDLSTNNPFFLWSANRKSGRVLFDISNHATIPFTPTDVNVVSARVVYRTLDNWSHQLSVAPTSYTPFYSHTLNNVNTNFDFVGIDGIVNVAQPWRYYNWSATDQPGRIFFPPSEAGKTISLSYTYVIGGVEKEVNNAVVTINPNWIEKSAAPVAAQELAVRDNEVPVKEWLAYAEPQIVGSGALPIRSIRSIRGLSIQARTAWLDGSNFSQISTIGFRGDSN